MVKSATTDLKSVLVSLLVLTHLKWLAVNLESSWLAIKVADYIDHIYQITSGAHFSYLLALAHYPILPRLHKVSNLFVYCFFINSYIVHNYLYCIAI